MVIQNITADGPQHLWLIPTIRFLTIAGCCIFASIVQPNRICRAGSGLRCRSISPRRVVPQLTPIGIGGGLTRGLCPVLRTVLSFARMPLSPYPLTRRILATRGLNSRAPLFFESVFPVAIHTLHPTGPRLIQASHSRDTIRRML